MWPPDDKGEPDGPVPPFQPQTCHGAGLPDACLSKASRCLARDCVTALPPPARCRSGSHNQGQDMFNQHSVEIEWAGRPLKLETGKVARQADGAVIATYGE